MMMRSLEQACHDLNQIPLLRELSGLLSARQRCYLVGGAIRDLFLGYACNDFDFVTPFDPTRLAQRLARNLSGHWFFLDEKRRQSRIVVPLDGGVIVCDFAPLRATSLLADLSFRDFTINAIAIRIHSDIRSGDLYDPVHGLEGLRAAELSICSENVLNSDPLRVLKGVRHCKKLHLTPNEHTVKALRAAAPLLQNVAKERVRKELGLILQDFTPVMTLRWLLVAGAAPILFGPWIQTGGISEVTRRLEGYEHNAAKLLASKYADFFQAIMREEFEEGFSRQATINLALLLQGRPINDLENVIAGMKLSRATSKALIGYLSLDSSKLFEIGRLTCGFRGRYWWLTALGPDPVGCLIYLVLSISQCRHDLMLRALCLAAEYAEGGKIADLVDGNWLCQKLKVGPGPVVGKALQALRCAEIADRVHSVEEAREFLGAWFKKSIDKI